METPSFRYKLQSILQTIHHYGEIAMHWIEYEYIWFYIFDGIISKIWESTKRYNATRIFFYSGLWFLSQTILNHISSLLLYAKSFKGFIEIILVLHNNIQSYVMYGEIWWFRNICLKVIKDIQRCSWKYLLYYIKKLDTYTWTQLNKSTNFKKI